jgi:transposase
MDRTMTRVHHMGMDVHKHFSRITARDAKGELVFRGRLEHGDREALRKEFRRWPAGTPVILEGTFGWGWMTDELLACGQCPHLTSGAKTKGWRQSLNRAKNNRLDADLLSELWLEPRRWWEVWLAPPQVREARERMRHRMGLVKLQTNLKNRIQAVLHRHGVLHPFGDLFGKQGRELLKELMGARDGRVPASAKLTLKGSLQMLDALRQPLAEATNACRKQTLDDPQALIWKSLPGIGWILACTIAAEIGKLERFKNAGHLASYSLLAPKDNDSGEEDPDRVPTNRHVGFAGRQTLKYAFLLAAPSAVRKSAYFRGLFNRLTENGTRRKMKGYLAVGHRLCAIGYACAKNNRPYSEEPPARAGGKLSGHHEPHSVPGGPGVAMAAAA